MAKRREFSAEVIIHTRGQISLLTQTLQMDIGRVDLTRFT